MTAGMVNAVSIVQCRSAALAEDVGPKALSTLRNEVRDEPSSIANSLRWRRRLAKPASRPP